MNEYILTLLYIVIGCIGSSFHYVKKRYIDNTTKDSFYKYLGSDVSSTYRTFFTIVGIAIAVASTDKTSFYLTPNELYTLFISGYTADSLLNKSSGSI